MIVHGYDPGMIFATLLALSGMTKKVVLISGDEEYRSEEMLPQLALILEKRHHFQCQVIYPVDKFGQIDPTSQLTSTSVKTLQSADLIILMTRFRMWEDSEMKYFDEYIKAQKPVIGIRTATHAFAYPKERQSPFAKYSWDSAVWEGGFGRQILGETWIAHHGVHMKESTRAIASAGAKNDPILNGVNDLWVPTDVYVAKPIGVEVLLLGQVLDGMNKDSKPVAGSKNDPMLPIAWKVTRGMQRVFTTTMGSAEDFQNESLRRLLVNAAYWSLKMPVPKKANVSLVGKYQPSHIGFGGFKKSVKPPQLSESE